jgi:hypothetical protein
VFGWPRTGTIEDPVNSIAMGSIVGGVGVFIFTMALAAHHRIRRRLGQQPLPAWRPFGPAALAVVSGGADAWRRPGRRTRGPGGSALRARATC